MFTSWLNWQLKQPRPYPDFELIEMDEAGDISPEVKQQLADALRDARFNPDFLEAMAHKLGWENVQHAIIERQIPRVATARRGEFGETLINLVLAHLHNYTIPVQKLRFKITSSQSLPSTDTLALKVDQRGGIVEVCFVESKLRTSADNVAAVDGCGQLREDYNSKLPDILTFVATRLFEQKNPLFEEFSSYMRDRKDTTNKDTFRLNLCWECNQWNEKTLENLQENGTGLPNLVVHVVRIKELRKLTDDVFSHIGIAQVSDDD